VFKKLELYGGLSASIDLIPNNSPDKIAWFGSNFNGSGYSIGLQAGATYFITRRLGLNTEINADYITFPSIPMLQIIEFFLPLPLLACATASSKRLKK
jgi:hypothetical protein